MARIEFKEGCASFSKFRYNKNQKTLKKVADATACLT